MLTSFLSTERNMCHIWFNWSDFFDSAILGSWGVKLFP